MISEWSAAQHADFALTSAMSFASTRALQNLGAFVLRNHPLELHEQFILGRRTAWCAHKQGLNAGTGKLLDQQNLVRVSSTQPVGRVDKDSLDQALGGKIAHTFKPRTDQARAAIPVVHSRGTSDRCSLANAISAAVWLAIVFSSLCLSDDTRA